MEILDPCAKFDLSSVFLWVRKWHLYTVNCLSQTFRSCSLFWSFCQSQRQSMNKSSWLYFQNIFSISSLIFILSSTTLGQSIRTHLGNHPLLPPSLAICLLPSMHSDVFSLLTRSYFSSIENLPCLPITLGIKYKLPDMANKSTLALVLANFTDLISYFTNHTSHPALVPFTLLCSSSFSSSCLLLR